MLLISLRRCAYHAGAFGRGQTKAIQCTQPKVGRYVFVRLRVTEYLTLCEVEVMAVRGINLFISCDFFFLFDHCTGHHNSKT